MNIQINILKFFQSIRNPILNAFFLILTISTEVPVIVILTAIMYWCINKKYGQKLLFSLTANIAINTGIKEYVKAPRPIGTEGLESLRAVYCYRLFFSKWTYTNSYNILDQFNDYI